MSSNMNFEGEEINFSGNEITLGYVPKRDGSDYDPEYVGPSWDQFLRAIQKYKPEQRLWVLYAGKVYTGQDPIGTIPVITAKFAIQHAAIEAWDPTKGRLVDITRNPENVPDLINLAHRITERPVHITGIVIRPID